MYRLSGWPLNVVYRNLHMTLMIGESVEVKASRLYTLDALRGLCALAVMLLHSGPLGHKLASSGYLAVDFFFVLSGFVVARTYEQRLQRDLTPVGFIKVRFTRLYPIFFIGFCLGLARVIAWSALGTGADNQMSQIAVAAATHLFMLPSPMGTMLFPLNGPAWSLFFEMAINIAYALVIFRLPSKHLLAIAATSAGVMVFLILRSASSGLNQGWDWATFPMGVARVTWGFVAGVLIARIRTISAPRSTWLAIIPLSAVFALVVPTGTLKPVFDTVFALAIAPLIVFLGARWQPPSSLTQPAKLLGDISYPLYMIHYPMLAALSLAARFGLPNAIALPLILGCIVAMAYGLTRWFDPPARRIVGAILQLKWQPATKRAPQHSSPPFFDR